MVPVGAMAAITVSHSEKKSYSPLASERMLASGGKCTVSILSNNGLSFSAVYNWTCSATASDQVVRQGALK